MLNSPKKHIGNQLQNKPSKNIWWQICKKVAHWQDLYFNDIQLILYLLCHDHLGQYRNMWGTYLCKATFYVHINWWILSMCIYKKFEPIIYSGFNPLICDGYYVRRFLVYKNNRNDIETFNFLYQVWTLFAAIIVKNHREIFFQMPFRLYLAVNILYKYDSLFRTKD